MKKFLSFMAAIILVAFNQMAYSSDKAFEILEDLDFGASTEDEASGFGVKEEKRFLDDLRYEVSLYPDDFESDDEGFLSAQKETPRIVMQEPELHIRNSTGTSVAIVPDVYDVHDLEKIKKENLLFAPGKRISLSNSFIDAAYNRRDLRSDGFEGTYEKRGGPVVFVSYWKREEDLIAFLDVDPRGNFLFQTVKKYYYNGIESQRKVIENNLPFPFYDMKHEGVGSDSIYQNYPFKLFSEIKKLNSSGRYELYIHRVETPIRKNRREYIHVMEYLDIRVIR